MDDFSLNNRKAQGGGIAQRGFDVQDNVVVAGIPSLLAHERFMALTSEAIGDIEIKFYSPTGGEQLHYIQVKSSELRPTEFFNEINQFLSLSKEKRYSKFTLVADLSPNLRSIGRDLSRIGALVDFYGPDSLVAEGTLQDFRASVTRLGQTDEIADFMWANVQLRLAAPFGNDSLGGFIADFQKELSHFAPISVAELTQIHDAIKRQITVKEKIITRKEIEENLAGHLPQSLRDQFNPIHVHTLNSPGECDMRVICLDWSEFSGGSNRNYPPPDEWNNRLLPQLTSVMMFARANRRSQKIKLTGIRRLSANLCIGAAFSAVSGFRIEVEHQGRNWSTDQHPTGYESTDLNVENIEGQGSELVVSIGIVSDPRLDVEKYVKMTDLSICHQLHIYRKSAIDTDSLANAIVRDIKGHLRQIISQNSLTKVHLFCAMPMFLGVLLGHRLNATTEIQYYEYVASSTYVPTVNLKT